MSETRRNLLSQLTKAQHELAKAQARVVELEAVLSQDKTNSDTRLDRKGYDSKPTSVDIYGLAKFPGENPNPLLRIGKDGTLLYANPSSQRLLAQWDRKVGEKLPEDLQQVATDTFATGTSREAEIICGDVYYLLTFVPFVDADYVHIYGQDITDRKRSETALKRYAQRMEILHDIDIALLEGRDVQHLVQSALSHLRGLVPCQRASVGVIDEGIGDGLIFAADFVGDMAFREGVRVPFQPDSFEGYDARNLKVSDDLRPGRSSSPRATQLLDEGVVSALSVLLVAENKPVGSLLLLSNTPAFFTPEYQEIAVQIGSQLALAIHQLHLSEELKRYTAELELRVFERTADLSAAKERVEAILDNSTDGILLVDTDLNIQQANASFNQLFGCEHDDYLGRPLVSLIAAEDVSLVTKTVQTAIAEQRSKSIEIRSQRKDGLVFEAELSIGHVKDGGMVCTFRDISERKAQEQQLLLHASLQESVNDAVLTMDMGNRIQSWNRAAERIYGWKAEEVVGRNAFNEVLRAPAGTEGEREGILQALQEQGTWQGEIRRLRKDGTELDILVSTTLLKDEQDIPHGVVAVHHDITERKAQERQLRASETRYRLLAENIRDVVMRLNTASEYVYVSPSVRNVLGYEPEGLLGQLAFNYIHPDDLEAVGQAFALATEPNLHDVTMVVRYRHKQGHYVWVESFGQV